MVWDPSAETAGRLLGALGRAGGAGRGDPTTALAAAGAGAGSALEAAGCRWEMSVAKRAGDVASPLYSQTARGLGQTDTLPVADGSCVPESAKTKTALMPRMAEQKDAHWAKLFMENGQRWFPLPLLSTAATAGAKAAAGDAPAPARLAGSPGRRRHHMPFHQRRVQQRSVQFGR